MLKIPALCLLVLCLNAVAWGAQPADFKLLNDKSSLLSDPAPIEAVQEELLRETGVCLWLVTETHLPGGADSEQIEIAAARLLQELDVQAGRPGILLMVLSQPKLLAIKGAPTLNLPQKRLSDIRNRVIIPRLREGDYQQGLLNGCQALAGLLAEDRGVELSFAPVAMERAPRWWQRVPLEPRHLWLPGLLALWYVIMKIRKKKSKKDE